MSNPQKPPKRAPRIKSAPKIRQLYWCDFPQDAQLPEFWKRRPVIILSYRNTLSGTVTVIPCSTDPQIGNAWAVEISTTISADKSWAICDKPYTVAVSRLVKDHRGIPRLTEEEFDRVVAKTLEWLPAPKDLQKQEA